MKRNETNENVAKFCINLMYYRFMQSIWLFIMAYLTKYTRNDCETLREWTLNIHTHTQYCIINKSNTFRVVVNDSQTFFRCSFSFSISFPFSICCYLLIISCNACEMNCVYRIISSKSKDLKYVCTLNSNAQHLIHSIQEMKKDETIPLKWIDNAEEHTISRINSMEWPMEGYRQRKWKTKKKHNLPHSKRTKKWCMWSLL